MSPLRWFADAMDIIKKDWRLLATLNALFFCVLIIGAAIALISPGLHLSMINFIGADSIASSAGISSNSNTLNTAMLTFCSSFQYLLMITVPSIVLPIWGPIVGAAKFFLWGVTYVAPLRGGITLGKLVPQYLLMIVLGEAYVIAIFACTRQLKVAVSSSGFEFGQILALYLKSVAENMKLLLIVIILLAAASLYQALIVPALTGIL